MGLDFPNPVGLAAGLDKNGAYINALAALGFGFIEIGTVTPRPQPGNPKPRMFRLAAEEAISNRMGFNNHGVDLVTLDMKLPDRSGSDLLDDIKRAHAATEVIMVTAYGSLQSAMDCIRSGAAGFLLKPFNASELLLRPLLLPLAQP